MQSPRARGVKLRIIRQNSATYKLKLVELGNIELMVKPTSTPLKEKERNDPSAMK